MGDLMKQQGIESLAPALSGNPALGGLTPNMFDPKSVEQLGINQTLSKAPKLLNTVNQGFQNAGQGGSRIGKDVNLANSTLQLLLGIGGLFG